MNLITIAWKNLCRRPARSVLTVVGLAAAVATVVALVGVARGAQQSFLSLYTSQGADLVVQRRGGMSQIAKGIPLSLADKIRKFPETHEVIAGLMDMIAFEDAGLFMVIANGWEPDSPVLRRVRLVSGRKLQVGDRGQVMLGRILAENLHKGPGDTVEIYARPFQVVGVFDSFSVYENGAVFMLMDELQAQMDRAGQATGFVVQAKPRGDAAAVERLRGRIEQLDSEIAATPCAQFVGDLQQIRATRSAAWVITVIATVIGAVGVFNTMAMTIAERGAEIGVLRAMGWKVSRVARLFAIEALMLAGMASLFGSLAGLVLITGISWWPPTSGLVQGAWPWSAVWLGVLLAFCVVLIGSLLSTWRIACLDPLQAIRGR
ncbi:MAG: ABC transporter permease [Pirellulales bacterium]